MTYGYLCRSMLLVPVKPLTFLRQLCDLTFVSNGLVTIKDELGILNSHDKHALDSNESMLAVGMGRGISLIHIARFSKRCNKITVIEASQEVIHDCKRNLWLNNISDKQINIINGFSGNPTNTYNSKSMQSSHVDINDLDYDVLELDCEGSEIEILEGLVKRPRLIIVEMHPMYREINIEMFIIKLESIGYYLSNAFKVDGSIVPISKVKSFFSPNFVLNLKKLSVTSTKWRSSLVVLNFLKKHG